MSNYIVMPLGVHVSPKMEITLIVPNLFSLHDLIHQPQRVNGSEDGISLDKKILVLIELATILHTLHGLGQPTAHGSLNTHNIFVEFPLEETGKPVIKLGELELSDFKRYANMFYNYRSVSVYSAPECLKQQKKRLDPTWQMDVYSFGLIMWELLYETVPFDGDINSAIEYVVKEDARPRILT